ncbi:DNA polymerase [Pseudomonas phage Cassandra]|nr:DNA polymerase [Pseudomonas phage Cassandra]WPK39309.1 DNA polymerase [Pseudomonas phage Deifobo]BDR25733.1 hypothetical protein RVBP16_1730 [Pseudomonas phage sp. 30-2]
MHNLTKHLLGVFSAKTEDEEYKSAKRALEELNKNIKERDPNKFNVSLGKVSKVTNLGKKKQYVYDIGMKNPDNPYFFGNNILVHNSCYFTAWPAVKDLVESGEMEWDKDTVIKLYDNVSSQVSDTFPEFLKQTFNVPYKNSEGVIKSGREIVATSGLFIKKKRYAAMMYDKEGTRYDDENSPGKVKAMGLDLRRSDTPKFVQTFLMEILVMVLTHKTEDEVIEYIREFKKEFNKMKPWEKGMPKGVNGISTYEDKLEEHMNKKLAGRESRITVPGHVSAAMNWNKLKLINKDLHTPKISDGQKCVVCYLKETADNHFTSIAYPVDELHLPEWFTSLPFDEDLMREKVVDNKVKNLLGILKWDFSKTEEAAAHFDSLFGW